MEYVICFFVAYMWVASISAAYTYARMQDVDIPEKLIVCIIAGGSWFVIGLLSVLHLWQDNCKRHVWVKDKNGEHCLLCGLVKKQTINPFGD